MVSKQEIDALFSKYIREMEEKARTKSSDIIPNGTIKHASVLIACLFSYAKKKIDIFTGHLNEEVYADNKVIDSAENFFKKDKIKMQILIQDSTHLSKKNDFFDLCKANKKFCKIREVDEKDEGKKNHFITIDDTAFRFEPDKNKPLGLGCFNNQQFATHLNERFVEMFGRGRVIPE